jgi:hypothetical protein
MENTIDDAALETFQFFALDNTNKAEFISLDLKEKPK